MTHVTLRPEFETLIDPYAPVGQVGTGFDFTEGPIWHPVHHYLLFSDMPGDVRRRWDAKRGVVEVKRPSNKCNGMTYDAELNLIVCEHATSSLIRERPDGRREVIASHFENQELNSPNDVCVHSSGAIYFSDPWYGRMPVYGVERPRQLGFQGVYRVPSGGGPPKLVVDRHLFDQPNGLCFSPDERLLYVNDTTQALIRVFDVEADGSLANARVFASGIRSELEPGLPDGMKCDQRGNVWVTAPGGVWVYSPAGELLGKVRVPELVANLAWGGADFRTLYLTATHSVYAIPVKAGPRHEPYMSSRASTGPDTGLRHACRTSTRRRRHAARSAALRDDHSGSAERRDHGGWRVRRFRLARRMRASSGWSTMSAALPKRRGRAASSSSMSGSSSSRARPASRSTRRCSKDWSIAARWCAEAGARRRFRGSSRAPAISSSRKCA